MSTLVRSLAALALALGLAAPPAAAEPPVRPDPLGDPLPPGARTRLGTPRLWHGPVVTALIVAPDGKTFFSAADDTVRQWDVASGREVRAFKGPRERVYSLALAPNGLVLATSSGDRVIRLWDVATGQELQRWKREEACHRLAFGPDGKSLALYLKGENESVCLWQVPAGRELRRLSIPPPPNDGNMRWRMAVLMEQEEPDRSPAVAYSPDGRHLLAGTASSFHLWDLATYKRVRRYDAPERSASLHPVFAPDSESIVGMGTNGVVLRWEVGSLEDLPPFSAGNQAQTAAAFSADGKFLAVASMDGTVRLWDVAQARATLTIPASKRAVRAVALTADSKTLLTGDEEGIVRAWDAATGKEAMLGGGRPTFAALAFAGSGETLVSADGGRLDRWEARSGKPLDKHDLGDNPFEPAALSADGQTLAVAREGGQVRLLDTATGKERGVLEVGKVKVIALLFAPDGRSLAVGGGGQEGRSLTLFDTATFKETRKLQGPGGAGNPLAFTPDGKLLLVGDGGSLVLWEVATGKPRRQLGAPPRQRDADDGDVLMWFPNRMLPIETGLGVAVTRDGNHMIQARGDSVCLVDLVSGRVAQRFEGPGVKLGAVALSPDGKLLAAGAADATVRLWDVAGGKELGALSGHRAEVHRLVFSADGKVLATASRDRTVLVWDVAEAIEAARQQRTEAKATRDREELWNELAGEDAVRADRAMQTLLTTPKETVAFLKERLRPVAEATPERLKRLLADLDSGEFDEREKAAQELERLGEQAEALLRQALAGKPSAELRRRLEPMVQKLDQRVLSSEQVRDLRALEVLEKIAGAEARQVLEALAGGAALDRRTREAKAALERLGRR
jgi:WD40 repeat protein